MRKVLLVLISIIVFIPNVYAKEKVTISVFYSDSCIHCKHLHEYLDELKNDSKYGSMFDIDYYEVHNKENSELFNKTLSYFKRSSSGVPFYVIGSKYEVGFPNPETMKEEYKETDKKIKERIESVYNKKEKDIVKSIKDGSVEVTTTEKQTVPLVKDENDSLETMNKKPNINEYCILIIPLILFIVIVILLKRKREIQHEE